MGHKVQRPRIALIASSFHPHSGGVEQHVRQVAGELTRSGHVVVVWTVDRGEHLGEQRVDGVPVHYLPCPLPARRLAAVIGLLAAAPRAIAAWWRAYRSFRPDVLHVQCFGPNGVYALILHRLSGTPLVVTSHGETFADDFGAYDESALLRASLGRALARATVVTAPSRFVLDDLRQRFGLDRGNVVPNGVHRDESAAQGEDELPALSGPVVLTVGRVERVKGFDLLLDAVARLDLPDLQVVIGGDGAELENLREQTHRLGLAGRVHLPGYLSPAGVAAAMGAADVVVVPSRYEAFGIVALEAWRAGTPVIGSVHGGMGEFVTDGVDGLIVDPTDVTALAGALQRVLGDDQFATRLAGAGRERVGDYSWEAVAQSYLGLYPPVGQRSRSSPR